jgi:hypothetical protein
MKSILPENNQDEIPVGFAIVGHVGQLPFLSLGGAIADHHSASQPPRSLSPLQIYYRTGPDGQEPGCTDSYQQSR